MHLSRLSLLTSYLRTFYTTRYMSGSAEDVNGAMMFPGDTVYIDPSQPTVFGQGLVLQHPERLLVTKTGVLRTSGRQNKMWIDSLAGRYMPAVEDNVIGTVLGMAGEYYRLDIGSGREVLLHEMSFDGATKRNRPEIPNGAAVYCRVIVSLRDVSPEVSCKVPAGVQAKEWVTGESLYGSLTNGMLFDIPRSVARGLLSDKSPVLTSLGKKIAFEMAVGDNGRLWINSSEHCDVILIAKCIQESEDLDRASIELLVQSSINNRDR